MIALHILIQARADPAAIVTAVPGEVPGVAGTASVAGPCDVIALLGTRDSGWYGEDARDERGVFGMARGREQLQRHGGDHARPLATAGDRRSPLVSSVGHVLEPHGQVSSRASRASLGERVAGRSASVRCSSAGVRNTRWIGSK